MDKFHNMSLYEIIQWLRDNDGWSKDWFDDELFPLIESNHQPKNINDLKIEMGLSYANESDEIEIDYDYNSFNPELIPPNYKRNDMLVFDYVCMDEKCQNKEERFIKNVDDFQFCSKCGHEMKKMMPRVGAVKGNFYNDKCGTK